ncbi:Hypothetical predicted protein [Mytilus galloprovincialis]|uniref:Uncharacterized protein n=1 Tax=Mytilus galloprovincialis TaxID=29158 RepID=A0A8B6H363_MYTGA|nr:Hypothetical predicted protein [Mytilus galloprovincialis]
MPYPLVFSSEENEYVQKEIDKFISKTIIQPVTPIKDQYVSNIFVRPKKDGTYRSDWEDIAKGGPGSSRHDISGTIVEHSELVSTNTSSDCCTVIIKKQSKKSSVSTPESNKVASFSEIAISSFQDIGEKFQNYGLSKESSEIIIAT